MWGQKMVSGKGAGGKNVYIIVIFTCKASISMHEAVKLQKRFAKEEERGSGKLKVDDTGLG